MCFNKIEAVYFVQVADLFNLYCNLCFVFAFSARNSCTQIQLLLSGVI